MPLHEWILQTASSNGEIGIGVLMFAENIILPIPSEYIMPMAGYLSERGALNFWGVIVAGTIGSLLGSLAWYGLGLSIRERVLRGWVARYGRWLTLQQSDIDRATEFFHRHGRSSVFFGRLIPLVRVLISVPAGLIRMPLKNFLLFSALGTLIWNFVLAYAGILLGRYFPQIEKYFGPLTWCVALGVVIWYVARVALLSRQAPSGESD